MFRCLEPLLEKSVLARKTSEIAKQPPDVGVELAHRPVVARVPPVVVQHGNEPGRELVALERPVVAVLGGRLFRVRTGVDVAFGRLVAGQQADRLAHERAVVERIVEVAPGPVEVPAPYQPVALRAVGHERIRTLELPLGQGWFVESIGKYDRAAAVAHNQVVVGRPPPLATPETESTPVRTMKIVKDARLTSVKGYGEPHGLLALAPADLKHVRPAVGKRGVKAFLGKDIVHSAVAADPAHRPAVRKFAQKRVVLVSRKKREARMRRHRRVDAARHFHRYLSFGGHGVLGDGKMHVRALRQLSRAKPSLHHV